MDDQASLTVVSLFLPFFLQVVGLYKKLGFVDDPEGLKGMAFQRKRKEKKGLALF